MKENKQATYEELKNFKRKLINDIQKEKVPMSRARSKASG